MACARSPPAFIAKQFRWLHVSSPLALEARALQRQSCKSFELPQRKDEQKVSESMVDSNTVNEGVEAHCQQGVLIPNNALLCSLPRLLCQLLSP